MSTKPNSVDDYLASLPAEQAAELTKVREAIHRAIPDAKEKISYSIPAVILNRPPNLHFAAWKKHIGLYPVHGLSAALEKRVAPHRKTKDMLGFDYADGIPLDLIEDVARELGKRPKKD